MITINRTFFHSPSNYLMELVISMHDYVIIILLRILILVLYNIINLIISNFFSLEFYEHHQLEIVWTIIPFLVLLAIAIPSLYSLYMLDTCFFCGISIRIIGHQWYWSYFYKDFEKLFIDSYILTENNFLRLLDTDNRLVIPINIPIRFIVSSRDVIHSWTVPSFGIKIDAIPGRISQFCSSIKRIGIFFGQCSEICGANHRFIPIVVECYNFENFMKII